MKTNKNYWQKRSEQVILDSEKMSAQVERTKLKRAYQEAYKSLVAQLDTVYAQLTEEGFSADMAKTLTGGEKKLYAQMVREYNAVAAILGKNGDYRPLKKVSTIIKGTRLTALKNQVEMQLNILASKKEQAVGALKEDVYKHSSYKTVFDLSRAKGAQVAFDKISHKQALQAIKSNWNGRNFSSDIWDDKTKLVNSLNQLIPQQFMIGTSTRDIAKQLKDKLNVSYRNAIRLARTETNFSANQAMEKTYKRAKVEKYQILATLDSRTSEICQEMDGYIGELKNARVGENYPPFHPNCRTTTIPYFDDEDEEERIARNEANENYYEKNMTYSQWLNSAGLEDTATPSGQTYERGVQAITKVGISNKDNENFYYEARPVADLKDLVRQRDNKLSENSLRMLKNYSYDGDMINKPLRNGRENIDKQVVQLATEMMQVVAKEQMTLYRGDDLEFLKQAPNLYNAAQKYDYAKDAYSADRLDSILSGESITEPGIRSTSSSLQEAEKFKGSLVWIIDVPEGTKGIVPINDLDGKDNSEKEILIAPGQDYEIKKVKYNPGKKLFNVYATVKNKKLKI